MLAVGDIHGCFTALQTLMDHVQPDGEDLLITLGDYVDRGPDSKKVLDWLIERAERGKLVCLRGNHEEMMLAAREGTNVRAWLRFGGIETLESFAEQDGPPVFDTISEEHWRFIEQTIPLFETDTHFFVHGNVDPKTPLANQEVSTLYWEKFDNPQPHCSGKTMVCGHTAQRTGSPVHLGHAVCLDTWVYGDGWLTCWEVGTPRYWQANNFGNLREGKFVS